MLRCFEPELWLVKVNGVRNFEFVLKNSWRYKKPTFVPADSIWSRNFENCGRVFFFGHQLFLRTNSKFQTPLTLTSHNSGSKHRSIENHHIFRFVRTSAFTWCSPCRVYEIRMSRKCGKHGKIPFFRFLSVPTVKKSWRPAFGQF